VSALRAADQALGLVLRAIPVLCLAALFVILFGNVLSRYFAIWSIAWFDEIVEALFAWMVFVGAAALWRENEHFRIDFLEDLLVVTGAVRGARALRILIALLSLAFLVGMAWKGWDLAARSRAVTPILGVPVAYVYASIPISAAIMSVYSLVDVLRLVTARQSKDR